MNKIKSNEDTLLLNADIRLCRLRTWPNYNGLGFVLRQSTHPPPLISLVESYSPALAGGLKMHDVLLVINNKSVSETNYSEVIGIINTVQTTDQPIELLVVRRSFYRILKKKNIQIDRSMAKIINTPNRMPEDYMKFSKYIPRLCNIHLESNDTTFGFSTIKGYNNIGAYIHNVIPNSPAYKAGLCINDRIIEIDNIYMDEMKYKFILEKLNKAIVKRSVKLLVVDTETYRYYISNKLAINEDDAYPVNQIASNQTSTDSFTYKSNNNNESLVSNESEQLKFLSSAHGYISLENTHEKFHSLNQNQISISSQQDHLNVECSNQYVQLVKKESQGLVAQYEYPNIDYQESSINDHIIQEDDMINTESTIKDDEYSKTNQRFFDVENEPLTVFLPIEGYEETPLLSLNNAITDLNKIIPNIEQNACIALERSIQPSDGLTSDESASIQLYTMEWTSNDQSLSMKINSVLRDKNRDQLILYFPYLKLILTALSKLKSITTTVWCGIKADVRSQYQSGKIFVWQGFSSCIKSRDLLESDKYLGNKGLRTLFNIECNTGKYIHSHSYYKHENEILLLPATQFQVINQDILNDNLYIIYLKEIQLEYTPIQQSLDINYSLVSPITDEDMFLEKKNSFHNQYLQEFINNHKMEKSITFPEQLLTINDMYLIANELQLNKYWCNISLHRTLLNEKHIEILMNALNFNLYITYLDLSSNQLDDNTSSIFANALKTNTYLETINLTDNKITEIGAQAFANMLLKNKTLLNLNLSSNDIGNNGMISIIRALQYNDTLKSLYLNQTNLTNKGGQEIAVNLEVNTNLKVLHLNENNLNDGGTMAIFFSLIENKQLNTLHLAMNNITCVGAKKIGLLLQETTSLLSELNISENPLGDMGIISIAQALTRNTTLVKLYLDSIEISIDGLRELIKMIHMNITLQYLSLNKNDINDDGIILLLDELKFNNVLTHLYLNNNKLTDECITNIIDVLKCNKTLKCLQFSNNQFTEQGKLILNETMKINRNDCERINI